MPLTRAARATLGATIKTARPMSTRTAVEGTNAKEARTDGIEDFFTLDLLFQAGWPRLQSGTDPETLQFRLMRVNSPVRYVDADAWGKRRLNASM
jgi:hypothetical protein